MKTIGFIGGMSWESTVTYYQIVNQTIAASMEGLHSAKILLYSVDFAEIEECQANGNWERSAQILSDAANRLEGAGADFIVICTNTMHKVAPQIQAQIGIPILHIATAVIEALQAQGIHKIALLGTKYTMCETFYIDHFISAGIEVVVPNVADIETVNRVIFEELCLGKQTEASKKAYIEIIDKMAAQGAQGVILGCTEIGLLIKDGDCRIPVFDTTQIHATKAAKLAIDGGLKDA